jgi:hypothetical protein
MRNNADEAERSVSRIPVAVRLVGGYVEGDARAHYLFPVGSFCYAFTLDHEDFVFIGMLMGLKNCSTLELDHAHGEIGGPFGLPDDPPDGLVLAHGFFGNVTIISTQHSILQN